MFSKYVWVQRYALEKHEKYFSCYFALILHPLMLKPAEKNLQLDLLKLQRVDNISKLVAVGVSALKLLE